MALEIIEKLTSLLAGGQDAALAVITSTAGSTPREAGTKMIVAAGRHINGTIGGGLGEEIIIRECLQALANKKSCSHHINLTADVTSAEGMICGGVMDVFVDYISSADQDALETLTKYLQSARRHENPLLITLVALTGADALTALGCKGFMLADGSLAGDLGSAELNSLARSAAASLGPHIKPGIVTLPLDKQQVSFFIEPAVITPEVLILGGGHIARPLVTIAALLGYQVTVVDDRPEFANIDRFPDADKVICANFEPALAGLDIGPSVYAVIVTRGHQYDLDCLRQLISYRTAYIGMIGSRKKIKAVMEQLAGEGIPPEKLAAVFAPIGLDIGAKTPEEIAVSIMAEIINTYRNGQMI